MSISEPIDIQHAYWAKDLIMQLTGCLDTCTKNTELQPEIGLHMFMFLRSFVKTDFLKLVSERIFFGSRV